MIESVAQLFDVRRLEIGIRLKQDFRFLFRNLSSREQYAMLPRHGLNSIKLHSELVEPVSFARLVRSDPDDDKFLEGALGGHKGYIVRDGSALLSFEHHPGINIFRLAEF
jgi:hypothetical protein